MNRQKPQRPVLGPSAFLDRSSGQPQRGAGADRKAPGQAEASYFQRLVDGRHPVTLRLRDGHALQGVLEWQDRSALRINVADGGHRVVPKSALATVERADESPEDAR